MVIVGVMLTKKRQNEEYESWTSIAQATRLNIPDQRPNMRGKVLLA